MFVRSFFRPSNVTQDHADETEKKKEKDIHTGEKKGERERKEASARSLEYANLGDRFVNEISKCVVGRKEIIRLMLVSLLSQGHVLIEGEPGLGKTTLARAFAQTIGGDFKRIQMTPDTLPADIFGTTVFNQQSGAFELHPGPIFGNVILVDELNRATPKAQ